ncbi:uncharacterized protein LOC130902127 [Diorhabda carinulata]|uniref:uncharacterized protein LOC130902127 n=1 Tax=Diorhabda carinulata TaxID=1163345 RepID=UPI0025A0FCE2|nr:uncharacterized protein LOC130902127 [Diorhabda carinulata]
MKYFYLLCLTISICGVTFGLSSEESVDERVQLMKDYFKNRVQIQNVRKKFESICPNYGHKFELALLKVQTCEGLIDKNEEETVCSGIKNHLEECTQPIVAVLEDCLPEKSKELPRFTVKTAVELSNYICKSDGEHIFELSNPCIMDQNFRLNRCILKTRSRLQQYVNSTPSKSEICEFIKSMRQCFKRHVDLSCNNVITRDSFIGLFDAVIKQCDTKLEDSVNEVDVD